MLQRSMKLWGGALLAFFVLAISSYGSEADLRIPELSTVHFESGGRSISGMSLLYGGLVVCVLGMVFGWVQYRQTKALDVHASMQNVSNVIWETCKTYLFQQGKFLAVLWVLIAACIGYYFFFLQQVPFGNVILILLASVLGMLGSYGVAWFGIRINTVANSRSAFASLKG